MMKNVLMLGVLLRLAGYSVQTMRDRRTAAGWVSHRVAGCRFEIAIGKMWVYDPLTQSDDSLNEETIDRLTGYRPFS